MWILIPSDEHVYDSVAWKYFDAYDLMSIS